MRVQKQQRRATARARKKSGASSFFFATVSMQEKKCDIERNNSFFCFLFFTNRRGRIWIRTESFAWQARRRSQQEDLSWSGKCVLAWFQIELNNSLTDAGDSDFNRRLIQTKTTTVVEVGSSVMAGAAVATTNRGPNRRWCRRSTSGDWRNEVHPAVATTNRDPNRRWWRMEGSSHPAQERDPLDGAAAEDSWRQRERSSRDEKPRTNDQRRWSAKKKLWRERKNPNPNFYLCIPCYE
jgi:hypothetical protein